MRFPASTDRFSVRWVVAYQRMDHAMAASFDVEQARDEIVVARGLIPPPVLETPIEGKAMKTALTLAAGILVATLAGRASADGAPPVKGKAPPPASPPAQAKTVETSKLFDASKPPAARRGQRQRGGEGERALRVGPIQPRRPVARGERQVHRRGGAPRRARQEGCSLDLGGAQREERGPLLLRLESPPLRARQDGRQEGSPGCH